MKYTQFNRNLSKDLIFFCFIDKLNAELFLKNQLLSFGETLFFLDLLTIIVGFDACILFSNIFQRFIEIFISMYYLASSIC